MSYCANCGQPLDDDANFCPNCGDKINNLVVNTISKRKIVKVGDVHKCPKCGEALGVFNDYCRTCGYVLNKAEEADSVKDLLLKLQQIDNERGPRISFTLISINDSGNDDAFSRFEADREDRKVELILNFVIPNSRKEILEFLMVASTSMRGSASSKIRSAWHAKFEQAYQKAGIIFGDTEDFEKVRSMYNKEKKRTKMRNSFTFTFYTIVTIISILIMIGVAILLKQLLLL